MALIIWKLRFAFYMWRLCNMAFVTCWDYAEASIESNPHELWEYGPIFYAQEEMAAWND